MWIPKETGAILRTLWTVFGECSTKRKTGPIFGGTNQTTTFSHLMKHIALNTLWRRRLTALVLIDQFADGKATEKTQNTIMEMIFW